MALTRRARRSNCSGRTSLRDALYGSKIWRDLREGGLCQGIVSDRAFVESDASSAPSDLRLTISLSLCTTITAISSAMARTIDRKSTRLNSSHQIISYAVFCLKKKKKNAEASERMRGKT